MSLLQTNSNYFGDPNLQHFLDLIRIERMEAIYINFFAGKASRIDMAVSVNIGVKLKVGAALKQGLLLLMSARE